MPFVWIGLLLLVLRWLEVGPFAALSWWWIALPLAAAVLWFEGLERWLGRDRRQVGAVEWEQRRKDRVARQFREDAPRR